ncbi:alpha-galactosidase [Suicoccus acidiformans]|uniref:Alpha-galactosidase n=1 Tax=Suicoccus acidiformans TaxID=2036206 RepID=A0A347WM78_9LACT|nr:alpha-galactosidase [Suicoccus acidiformans]AXY26185.1 alpha-galactosidase [Suicoccus acidiformans]
MDIIFNESSRTFHLYNSDISYIIKVMEDNSLSNLYYGKRVSCQEDYDYLIEDSYRPMTNYVYEDSYRFTREYQMQEFPVHGTTDYRQPAIIVEQKNGSDISYFEYVTHKIAEGKADIPGLPSIYADSSQECQSLAITLMDPLTRLSVTLNYTIFKELPVITRSVQLSNQGEENLTITRIMSLSLDIPNDQYKILQLSGAWGRERHPKIRNIEPGLTSIASNRGNSSHHHNPFLALLNDKTDEFSGKAIGLNFVYSGNFLGEVELDNFNNIRINMGINPENFAWQLTPGEDFYSPEVVMVYSDKGLNRMSQTFHQLYRNHLTRGYWHDKARPILINNWEATRMDFTEDQLFDIAKKASECGIELFVLDDGWFGDRRNDKAGLGDWYPSDDIFENGLTNLVERINSIGLDFGIWFEPEMVNKDSNLYRAHPEWVIHTPNRHMSHGRNQFVLDYANPEVVDYIYDSMEKVLSSANIKYVKWDMNRSMTEVYSSYLPANRQKELSHRYILGVYHLYERLQEKFPEILFEFCSSGGGRFDPGMLYYSPQGWTSDNTDAIDRLKIQYGTSIVYPLSSIGSHVTASPNETTYREVPITTRGNVSYFGSFGYELDLNYLTENEIDVVKEQVKFVKEYRELIHNGLFYRLMDPFNTNYCAWMVVSEDQSSSIVGNYKILNEANWSYRKLKLKGLDPDALYHIDGDDRLYYGSELMNIGLVITDGSAGQIQDDRPHSYDFDSKVYVLKKVE